MKNNIFCPNCGYDIRYSETNCSNCGFSMSESEKKQISKKLSTVENNILVDDNLKKITELSNQELFNNYMLSGKYFLSDTAKEDYDKKVNFLKNDLIPKVNDWRKSIEDAQKTVAKDKVEVYGRIIAITDFILKEFFGPFTVKENGLQVFEEYKDFSMYRLSETISNSDLNFSDIKTTNFGSIGNDIMKSVGNTLSHGSLNEISKKGKWSKSDIKTVKTEVGIAVAGELISGISNMIGQNFKAIEAVREADKELNKEIKQISNVISSLSIEENEIEKQKRLYDKSDIILDTCYLKVLKPIVEELNADQVYLEYKNARKPFDNQQELIKIDNELLSTKIKIPFWSVLLKNKIQNYQSNWKKRINILGKFERYNGLLKSLNIKIHKTLSDFKNFENQTISDFKEFEKIHRRTLKKIPAIAKNSKDVVKFAGVLKQVKTNITK